MHQTIERTSQALFKARDAFIARWNQGTNKRSAIIVAAILLVGSIGYANIFRAPSDFPVREIITIPENTPLMVVAEQLEQENVIHSAFWFRIAVTILDGETGARAGDYYFAQPQTMVAVARRMVTGAFGLEPIRIRIVEGATVNAIAPIVARELPRVTEERFKEIAGEFEGYLFPDTYFFLPSATEETVVRALRDNFDRQIAQLVEDIENSGRTLADMVIMASILEKEAFDYQNKRIIAGILWKRLDIGMLLQVDAPFVYIIGKGTFGLTRADLRMDSPYNTYRYHGLPPTAIANPSFASLKAAANPIDTPYLFFLDGYDGVTRFSATYEEHLEYKRQYIDNY
jgi:UPF0755 protein